MASLWLLACSPGDYADTATVRGFGVMPRPEVTEGRMDADGDGYPSERAGGDDCDDADSTVHPGAQEDCDSIDSDCDGVVDEGGNPWYYDADGDGYGAAGDVVYECERPLGYAPSNDDCNDADATYYPGAPEDDCTDPHDYNCDGAVAYADEDGDGYAACVDCRDTASSINPGAIEECDGVDEDCDGVVDNDALDATQWYEDADGDSYGNRDSSLLWCEQPEGYVLNWDDCDDTNPEVSPSDPELCSNGVDDNCNGHYDEDEAADATVLYRDRDGDGYGNSSGGTYSTCFPEMSRAWSASNLDCDDDDRTVYPGAEEVCDGFDNDCDPATLEVCE